MNGEGICEISGKLFLMYTFVQPPVNYTNIAKFKIHVKKNKSLRQALHLAHLMKGPLFKRQVHLWHRTPLVDFFC